jgi:hypothetical protein
MSRGDLFGLALVVIFASVPWPRMPYSRPPEVVDRAFITIVCDRFGGIDHSRAQRPGGR